MRTTILIAGVLSGACADDPGEDSSSEATPEVHLRDGLWSITPTKPRENACGFTKEALSIGMSVLARVVTSADGATFTRESKDDTPTSTDTLTAWAWVSK
jgi:hypothetical protein